MFRFLKRLGGDCVIPVAVLPAKANEAFVRGTPVNLESGLCTVAAAGDTEIVGIANQTLTPAADGEELEVILALPDVLFEADFIGTSKPTLANADIGAAFDLGATTNADKVNLDDTTGGMWVVFPGWDNTAKKVVVKLLADNAATIVGGITTPAASG